MSDVLRFLLPAVWPYMTTLLVIWRERFLHLCFKWGSVGKRLYHVHQSEFNSKSIRIHSVMIISNQEENTEDESVSFFWPQARRIAQQREVLQKERETAEKIAAHAYTKQYLADLLPAVFTSLRSRGYFCDPVVKGQPLLAALPSSLSLRSEVLLSDTWGHHCTPLHTAEDWSVTIHRWGHWYESECLTFYCVCVSVFRYWD